MEALALMLIHVLTPGGLSWTRNGVPKTDSAHNRLKREKLAARPEDLCRGLPDVFEEFLRYCRRLKFAECPDYGRWREAFMDLAVESGFPEDDAFVWPPPQPEVCTHVHDGFTRLTTLLLLQPSVRAAPHGRTSLPGNQPHMEGILKDLAHLRLEEPRQILAERANNIPRVPRPTKLAQGKKDPATSSDDEGVIVISDSENGTTQKAAAVRLTKASQLAALARIVPSATDNVMLARVVREFVEILDSSRSKALTKEGFAFLDALHKQLADPSVYAVPLRTSRTRSGAQQEAAPNDADARRAKMDKLFALRRDVPQAKTNRMLAKLVADFGACIDKSKGRTITKDAMGFLNGLADKLRTMP
jgi:casein kinase 1